MFPRSKMLSANHLARAHASDRDLSALFAHVDIGTYQHAANTRKVKLESRSEPADTTSPHKEANMRRNVPLSLSLSRGLPLSRQAPSCCRHSRSISMGQAVALPDSTESLLAESGHIACRLAVGHRQLSGRLRANPVAATSHEMNTVSAKQAEHFTVLVQRALPDGRFVVTNSSRRDIQKGTTFIDVYAERGTLEPEGHVVVHERVQGPDVALRLADVEFFRRSIESVPCGHHAGAGFDGTGAEALRAFLEAHPTPWIVSLASESAEFTTTPSICERIADARGGT